MYVILHKLSLSRSNKIDLVIRLFVNSMLVLQIFTKARCRFLYCSKIRLSQISRMAWLIFYYVLQPPSTHDVACELGIVFDWTFALRQCSLSCICCFDFPGFYWYFPCVILFNCCLWVFFVCFLSGVWLSVFVASELLFFLFCVTA